MTVSRPIIGKIPGILPPPPKTELDGKITDLTSKSTKELIELRDRQLKLLNNKLFISKLPDKGAKIKILYEKIVEQLKLKSDEDETCKMLERLKPFAVQDIEWQKVAKYSNNCLDSDDESDPEDDKQMTEENRRPIHLRNRSESETKEHFKPYKTTKSDVHNPKKEILRKKPKNWEITAATPPPIVNGPTQLISIDESIKLQKDYNKQLKIIQATHAEQKLLERCGIQMPSITLVNGNFDSYRDVTSEQSDNSDAESIEEVHDEEPERGVVVYNVMN